MPIAIFILFFCAAFILRERALMDPDTGWHIAAGDLIRELGRLPQSDPWSYTADGAPWFNISWAYDVALSFLHQAGGLPAAAVATVFLYALCVAAIAAIARASADSIIAAAPVTVLCGVLLLPGMLVRPQIISYLLVAGFYAALRFGGRRSLWLLPVLMAAWANVHGAFLAGFVIVGAFFLEAVFAKEARRALSLAIVGLLCAAALFVNPYGFGLIHGAMLTMSSPMQSVIGEWRPATLGEANIATFFLIAFFLVSAVYDRRIPLADKLLAFFWLYEGLSSERMMQFAGILAAPYLARGLALRMAQLPVGAALARRDEDYAADFSRGGVRLALAGTAVLLVAAALAPPVQRLFTAPGAAFSEFAARTAPDGAIDYLAANYRGVRLYNDYDFGGYLVFRERGRIRVFFDGRADTAFPRSVLKDGAKIGYLASWKGAYDTSDATWSALVDKYGIEGFLTSASRTRLHETLESKPGWTKVYEDDRAAFFVRDDLMGR